LGPYQFGRLQRILYISIISGPILVFPFMPHLHPGLIQSSIQPEESSSIKLPLLQPTSMTLLLWRLRSLHLQVRALSIDLRLLRTHLLMILEICLLAFARAILDGLAFGARLEGLVFGLGFAAAGAGFRSGTWGGRSRALVLLSSLCCRR
jgi:hypothetical protein